MVILGEVQTPSGTVRGVSVGGVFTSLYMRELDLMFDAGYPLRQACSVNHLLLSHGHADHIGALPTLLGIRGLMGIREPLKVLMPAELVDDLTNLLAACSRLHRWPLRIEPIPMRPGDEVALRRDLVVRAIPTFHDVPSLGYLVLRRVNKLRQQFLGLPGEEIARRRQRGDDLFHVVDHTELGYATDTLPRVLAETPELLNARTLILECTFLDHRKSLQAARDGHHVHLDELLPFAGHCNNERLVLMHFSQIYHPDEIAGLIAARWPEATRDRVRVLVPPGSHWWG